MGNVLGGLLLGLMASMGPSFGYPQMMISRAVMGRSGNVPFAVANWICTVGWFTVNIILGGYALQLAFGLPFYVAAGILVVSTSPSRPTGTTSSTPSRRSCRSSWG